MFEEHAAAAPGGRQRQRPNFEAWLAGLDIETLSAAAQDYLAGPAARVLSYTHVQVGGWQH